MIPCYLALILCLLSSPAEGRGLFASRRNVMADRHHPSATVRDTKASTWNLQSNLHSTNRRKNAANHHHAAFLTTVATPRTTEAMKSIKSSSRLSFLSHVVQSPLRLHQAQMHHLPHIQSTKQPQRRRCSPLFASKEGNSEDDEECSLQKLYEQVQEEDSDWYYQTLSKLLDEEPTIPPCGDETDVAKEDKIESGGISSDVNIDEKSEKDVEEKVEEVEANSDDNTVPLQSDEQVVDQKEAEEIVETTAFEEEKSVASNAIDEDDEEPQIVSNIEKKQPPELQQPQKSIEQEKEKEIQPPKEKLQERAEQQYSSFEDEIDDEEYDRSSPQSKRWEKEDDYESDYYDEEYEDDDYYDNKDRNPVRKQPVQEKKQKQQSPKPPKTNTSPQSSPPSPQIVRLRNTDTNEIENLAPLPTLTKLGYSEKELIVLRPQVLELIVEDGIPRPAKGLPKRWVRLNRLEGYEGEVEEEDDEDVDWEVEVVARKTGKEREPVMEGPETVDSKIKEVDEPEYSSKPKGGFPDDDELVDLDDEPLPDEGSNNSQQSEPSPYDERDTTNSSKKSMSDDEVTESRGPFSSSHVSDGRKERSESTVSTGAERDVREETPARETDASSKRQQQRRPEEQPLEAEDDDSIRRRNNRRGENDEDDRRRRPQTQKKKQRDDYDDPRSKTPPPQRQRDDQQKRRRRRPPSDRKQLLVIDRGNSNNDFENPAPNKFWMDLPTFRDFLRKEAQLRIQIIGPDWKESVLDESRWRYDLYKTWLTMLDEGVGGENPLYEYSDVPRERKNRSNRRPEAPPRGPQARSRGDERGYDRSPSSSRPRQQRQTRQEPEPSYDNEDDDYFEDRPKPRRRPKSSEVQREDRDRSRQGGDSSANSDQQQPPPPRRKPRTTTNNWTNFNDLEASLLGSSEEKMRPQREYDDDYEESFDDKGAPRRRRAEARPRQREYADRGRTNDDLSYKEEDYDDSSDRDVGKTSTKRRRSANSSDQEPGPEGRYDRRSGEGGDYDESLEEESDAMSRRRRRRSRDELD